MYALSVLLILIIDNKAFLESLIAEYVESSELIVRFTFIGKHI